MNDEDIILPVKYVEKLQQKNAQLKEKYLNAVADYETTKSKNQQLHNRINKAIKYLEANGYGYDCCGDMCYFLDEDNQKDLLGILKDSDTDE